MKTVKDGREQMRCNKTTEGQADEEKKAVEDKSGDNDLWRRENKPT